MSIAVPANLRILLTNTGVQELVQCHLEVDRTGDPGREAESDDGVPVAKRSACVSSINTESDSPRGKVQQSTDQEVWDLGDDLTEAECPPGVDLGFFLSGLEDVSVGDELGLRLGNHTG